MKLKLFTIGLLATIAMTSTSVEAAGQLNRMKQAQQEVPVLQAQVAAGGAAHPNLNIGGAPGQHADNNAAINNLHTRLGTHAAAAVVGDTANHRMDALHTALGHDAAAGAANDDANKKVQDAIALIEPGQPLHTGIVNVNALIYAGGPIPDAHGKITHVNNMLGYAAAPGAEAKVTAAIGQVGVGGVAGSLELKLTNILNRLNAATHNAGAGGVPHLGGNTPVVVAGALHAGGGALADIEAALTRIGL